MTKILTLVNAKSKTIITFKRIHQILGYLVVLSCKVTVYIKAKNNSVWIGTDAAFIFLYILTKVVFPRMEARQIKPKIEEK